VDFRNGYYMLGRWWDREEGVGPGGAQSQEYKPLYNMVVRGDNTNLVPSSGSSGLFWDWDEIVGAPGDGDQLKNQCEQPGMISMPPELLPTPFILFPGVFLLQTTAPARRL
jgi:hypothetical protein